jgi:hypothetical protein
VRAGALDGPAPVRAPPSSSASSPRRLHDTCRPETHLSVAMLIRQGKAEGWLQADTATIRVWLRHNGVKFGAIEPKIVEGRGTALVASEDLRSSSTVSQEILTIPKDMVLSIETVHSHALFDQDLKEVVESLGDWGRVCLSLLAHSSWKCFQKAVSCTLATCRVTDFLQVEDRRGLRVQLHREIRG